MEELYDVEGDSAEFTNALDVKTGLSPFHLACKENRFHIVELFLSVNAEVNSIGRDKNSALMYAIQERSTESFNMLLEGGADIHVVGNIFNNIRDKLLSVLST